MEWSFHVRVKIWADLTLLRACLAWGEGCKVVVAWCAWARREQTLFIENITHACNVFWSTLPANQFPFPLRTSCVFLLSLKTHGVHIQCCLYVHGCRTLRWSMDCFCRGSIPEENGFFLPSEVSKLGWGTSWTPPHPSWDFGRLGVAAFCSCVPCCPCPANTVSLQTSTTVFLTPLCCDSWASREGGGVIQMFHLELSTPSLFYSQHTDLRWVSINLHLLQKEASLMRVERCTDPWV